MALIAESLDNIEKSLDIIDPKVLIVVSSSENTLQTEISSFPIFQISEMGANMIQSYLQNTSAFITIKAKYHYECSWYKSYIQAQIAFILLWLIAGTLWAINIWW